MNISFNLKDRKQKETAVRIIITHNGKVYRKNSGVFTSPSAWAKQKTGNSKKDAELKRIRLTLMENLDERSTEQDIKRELESVVNGEEKKGTDSPTSLWKVFEEYSNREMPSQRKNKCIFRTIKKLMGTGSDWDDIDVIWGSRLIAKMNERGFTKNYQATLIGNLKTIMNYGLKYKYHTNTNFKFISSSTEVPDTVYLTQEEVDRLWRFKGKRTEMYARDLFMVGIYTASRFCDYSKLTSKNISNGRLRFIQLKTGGSVVMPVAPRILEIMDKYNGELPKICHETLNHTIKEVCQKVGIDDPVIVSRTEGGKRIQHTYKKYELVSAHTARRTGATLLYMNGVSIKQCMFITGHTSESSFMRYIRITKEENATMLENNPFFK